jgi:hypothetical protein
LFAGAGKRFRLFASVAIRDGQDLFLWLRVRRASSGIYCVIPIGRSWPDRKEWNPHGSHHRDGRRHFKSFGKRIFPAGQRQKPDSDFTGSETLITWPIASHEPRAVGVICDRAEFYEVMEVPASILSSKKYETHILIDLTEPDVPPIVAFGEVVAQQAFKDAPPWIWVTVTQFWPQFPPTPAAA